MVVGNSEVGKSVFICNALDLKRQPSSISSCKVSLGGVSYRLQLVETPCEAVNFASGRILWPPVPETGAYPKVDGAFCLYDVSDRDSIDGLAEILAALDATGLPTCLVSCKVDIPVCDHEVHSQFPQQVKSKFPDVVLEKASLDESDTAKRCLLQILRQTLAKDPQLPGRSRREWNAASNFPLRTSSRNPSASSSRSPSRTRIQSMHSKSRENLLTAPPPPVLESGGEEESEESSADEEDLQPPPLQKKILRLNTNEIQLKPRTVNQPQTPISTTTAPGARLSYPSKQTTAEVPATPESIAASEVNRRGSTDTYDSRIYRTFLEMDDESPPEDHEPARETAEQFQKLKVEDDKSTETKTLDELVDRLLAMPRSKSDQKFVPSFLCLYRAFATPLQLLIAFIERFVKTETGDLVAFTKAAECLRYLSILGLWTTHYPGDFAESQVRDMVNKFVTEVEKQRNYSAAAKQIANNLQIVIPDEDEEWAYCNSAKPAKNASTTTSRKSSEKLVQKNRKESDDDEDSDSDSNMRTHSSPRHSATASSVSSLVKSSYTSSQTSDSLHNLESAREQALKYQVIPNTPIAKSQWHYVMALTTEELAMEITRIDWTMYCAIRPRDFVRYATMSISKRVKAQQTDYIGMMTRHFNHLALFVSGMILLRDKPKHRAKMLEQLYGLAWKVRQMNNYHALGAIVAALNSEEIVRLTQTQELIPQEKHKQFRRLKILMSHQKSHAAYRMAWDNSSAERIPFLPRIQEDLMKAASANATFVKGRINWNKFEVMGETIISVQRSQEQPYNFPERSVKIQETQKLILETKVLKGDEVSCEHRIPEDY